jgi:predicted nuclease of predicted toxin-antitoxin system
MRFKVDENLPIEVADLLQSAGFDAETAVAEQLAGTSDPTVAEACQREGRVLVTLDLGFGDIRAYPPEAMPGIIVLRLHREDKPHILAVIKRLLLALSSSQPTHEPWVVEERRIRVRPRRAT